MYLSNRVGRQVVNVPSFLVRVDSDKHINFSLNSPLGQVRLPSYLILVFLITNLRSSYHKPLHLDFVQRYQEIMQAFPLPDVWDLLRRACHHIDHFSRLNSNLTSLALCVTCVITGP